MALKLSLDPQEAWQPFEPSADEPFDRRAAAHLYRRAGFAASSAELEAAVTAGPHETLERMLASDRLAEFTAEMDRMAQAVLAGNNPEALSSWWLYRMRHTPAPLLEKTAFFWHGHFATSGAKVKEAKLLYRQNELLRQHALGSFAAMVQGIARDPAMLIYLDSATNRKTHPNENFAREVMELFCLGVGKYSEKDIQELAKCFTGWEIQHGEFKFNSYQHDYGTKRLFGHTGKWDGDEAIGQILEQPAAAEFLCTKLVRFFVADELALTPEQIAPLEETLRQAKFRIEPLLKKILTSRTFYHPSIRAAKVGSPVDLALGLLRALEANTNMHTLVGRLREIGQLPLFPPNVKGWNGGREWINASTILGRANLVRQILELNDVRFGGDSLEAYLERMDLHTSGQIVDRLCELLTAVDPPAEVRSQLTTALDRSSGPRELRLRHCVHAIMTLPEAQLA
jgi:uncharacterized protein (DUF1800 family)